MSTAVQPAAVAKPAPALNRGMITVTVMLASIMQSLDNTIANVALPRMQGTLSATQDQMTWVLTSYIVAAAIMTPLSGWLAGQFGRKRLFVISVAGFTIASVLCGLAQTLPQIVLFRLVQGLCGAALVPMSQAVLLDINPPERHGRAMATWGLGVVAAPLLGPVIGGWLTDTYSWRWVFYINIPIGILTFLGLLSFMPETPLRRTRFDFFGFALLSLAVGGLQLMLDRGSLKDWFSSTEIWIEFTLAGLALYLFIVHSATAKQPFIRPALFKDQTFLSGNIFIFIVGAVIFATMALLPPILQNVMNYPTLDAGLAIAPRGIGSLVGMALVGRLVGRIDGRLIIGTGFAVTAFSLWQMTQFSPLMDTRPVFWSGVAQGLGTGLAYIPLATLSFATLAPELRNEGAAFFSLMRNVGSSVGISAVQALFVSNTQAVHAALAAHITPFNLAARQPQIAAALASPSGMAALNQQVTMQASMVAYNDDFKLMMVLTLVLMPVLLLMRSPKPGARAPTPVAIE